MNADTVTSGPLSLHFYGPTPDTFSSLEHNAVRAREVLEQGTGPGASMRGWLDLPQLMLQGLPDFTETVERARDTDRLIVIGVGGSRLGAAAILEALKDQISDPRQVIFEGHHLDALHLQQLLSNESSQSTALHLISKSGSTMEPWLVFQLLHRALAETLSPLELQTLVTGTTGLGSNPMREYFAARQYKLFDLAQEVGGRYSVLSPVGLFPLGVAGLDIGQLLKGASAMMDILRDPHCSGLNNNPALAYAAYRHAAHSQGRKVEMLMTPFPRLSLFAEWWRQLFGESEGKGGKGPLPSSMVMTSELHSLGQWLQDGEPIAFETAIDVEQSHPLPFLTDSPNDPYSHLNGKSFHEVNRTALAATMAAHSQNDTPCLRIEIPTLDEYHLGALIYFFEYSCAISAYMFGVNPFDQPGVEAYKSQMKTLLGKI